MPCSATCAGSVLASLINLLVPPVDCSSVAVVQQASRAVPPLEQGLLASPFSAGGIKGGRGLYTHLLEYSSL